MLLADSFILSSKARNNEFTTSKSIKHYILINQSQIISKICKLSDDTPLVVQFASNNVSDFVGASVLVSP